MWDYKSIRIKIAYHLNQLFESGKEFNLEFHNMLKKNSVKTRIIRKEKNFLNLNLIGISMNDKWGKSLPLQIYSLFDLCFHFLYFLFFKFCKENNKNMK